MKQKTQVHAQEDKQEILITREFALPVELLFKAHVEAQLVEQWMGTQVVKLESKKHGSFQFVTTDPKGNKYGFSGTIHELMPNEKIICTFQMDNTSFPVQLEFLEFVPLSDHSSKLTMHVVYKSVADRDNILKLPFTQGINFAHNRLEEVVSNLN